VRGAAQRTLRPVRLASCLLALRSFAFAGNAGVTELRAITSDVRFYVVRVLLAVDQIVGIVGVGLVLLCALVEWPILKRGIVVKLQVANETAQRACKDEQHTVELALVIASGDSVANLPCDDLASDL
jgi:hypothetical protein